LYQHKSEENSNQKKTMIIKANRGFGPGFCEIGAKFGCGTHVKDLQKQNNIHN
jgi:hypothetical protein